MFGHAHDTELSHSESMQMAKFKYDFTRLSVCLSTILEFHNKWLLFLGHHCLSFLIIVLKFCKTLQLLRSSGNRQTHTQTDYYNPPPMLRLINAMVCVSLACLQVTKDQNGYQKRTSKPFLFQNSRQGKEILMDKNGRSASHSLTVRQ